MIDRTLIPSFLDRRHETRELEVNEREKMKETHWFICLFCGCLEAEKREQDCLLVFTKYIEMSHKLNQKTQKYGETVTMRKKTNANEMNR